MMSFETWLARLIGLYPQVEEIYLVGSRAVGHNRPDSDYDVIVRLQGNCYRTVKAGYCLEQAITFDPRLIPNQIDLFFCHDDGHFTRWVFGFRDGLMDGMDGDLDRAGDWAPFYRDLDKRRLLFNRQM